MFLNLIYIMELLHLAGEGLNLNPKNPLRLNAFIALLRTKWICFPWYHLILLIILINLIIVLTVQPLLSTFLFLATVKPVVQNGHLCPFQKRPQMDIIYHKNMLLPNLLRASTMLKDIFYMLHQLYCKALLVLYIPCANELSISLQVLISYIQLSS